MIAAWADISAVWTPESTLDSTTGLELAPAAAMTIGGVNVGYIWMAMNCLASAAYVSILSVALADTRSCSCGNESR